MEELPIPEGCYFTATYRETKAPRSAKYQFVFHERNFNEFHEQYLNDLPDESQLYSEEREEVREAIKARCWELMKEHLTPKQYRIVRVLSGYDVEGNPMTQSQAGVLLGINQSTITKQIFGNQDPLNPERYYGGVIKKMRRFSKDDEKLRSLLERLADLDELLG